MESALRERLAPPTYTTSRDTTETLVRGVDLSRPPAPIEFASASCATDPHRSSLAVDHRLVAVDPKLNSCATVMAHPGIAASKIGGGKTRRGVVKGLPDRVPIAAKDLAGHQTARMTI